MLEIAGNLRRAPANFENPCKHYSQYSQELQSFNQSVLFKQ